MRQTLKFSWIILLFISCWACAQKESVLKPIDFEKVIQKENIQVLDVRTSEEFASGYIKNAMLADWNDPDEFQRRTASLDKKHPVAVYCLAGGRSAKAAQYLTQQGFSVYELAGGMNAWNKENLPVENASNLPEMEQEYFDNAILSQEWVLVDVGAKWCPPCRQMEPIVTDFLGNHPEIKLQIVDGGKDKKITKALEIEVMPTFILYRNGEKVWSKSGVFSIDEFEKAIK